MAKDLRSIVVVDLEATCWEQSQHIPKGMTNEIIEIGIAKVVLADGNVTPVRCPSIVVKPAVSEISKFCTQLTGWTQARIATEGVPLLDACGTLLRDHTVGYKTFASWGDYDRNQFTRECRQKGLRYPFGPTHMNVKNLFAVLRGITTEVGVGDAMEMLGMKFDGRPHNGGDDAYNIARVLSVLIKSSRTGHPEIGGLE